MKFVQTFYYLKDCTDEQLQEMAEVLDREPEDGFGSKEKLAAIRIVQNRRRNLRIVARRS
jgi:hypothetical protein